MKLSGFCCRTGKHVSVSSLFQGIAAVSVLCLLASTAVAASSPLPLHEAVQQGNASALKSALDASDSPNIRDADGRTALVLATQKGDPNAVQVLLEAGASADVNDFLGRAPLHYATRSPLQITRLLLESGADVDIRNSGGVTSLMQAAGEGRRDIVKLLLTSGARVDYKDYQGNTAEDWAKRSGDEELAAMLARRIETHNPAGSSVTDGENFAEDVFVDVHFPGWFQPSFLDFRDDVKEAVANGKQGILLFLSTRRCSYCKAFIDNVLSLPDVRRQLEGAYDVIGLEIFDKSRMTDPAGNTYRVDEFVTAAKASFTPTLIFYGANGNAQLKIVGYYPPDKFRRVLEYLDGGHYEQEPLREFLSRKSGVTGNEQPIRTDYDLFSRPPYMLDRTVIPAQVPMVVVFESPACESCELFHERVLSDKSVRRLMGEFESVQLDATDTSSRVKTPAGEVLSPAQWYEKLDLSYSPAIVFFDQAGEEAMRLDSETQRFRMEGSLQLVLEGGYKEDAQLQRWRWRKAVQVFNENQP